MYFPQYRKYKNNKSYFKILSNDKFEEIIVRNGDKYFYHEFTAKILPDRNLISDMLSSYMAHWDVITEEEYEAIKKKL